jgi:SpoVK/Ycf46/Vps4 family AAA+-type ATPase
MNWTPFAWPRGQYLDCISQEVTAQLLEEIDGIESNGQAVFVVAATNRPDLSRFSDPFSVHRADRNRLYRALKNASNFFNSL